MSRRAIDPVDRAFEHWRRLTAEQRQQLADRIYGYNVAAYDGQPTSEAATPRKRTRKPAAKEAAAE